MTGILIGRGEIEVSAGMLRQLGVSAENGAVLGYGRVYRYPDSKFGGFRDVTRNGVPVGFLRWNARGKFYWHALVEH